MEVDQITYSRLYNQQISVHDSSLPEKVVGCLGAIQAQDYQASLWAIGIRCKNPSLKKVEQAIAQCKIVRTWALRHTLHFVLSSNIKWMLNFYYNETIPKYRREDGLTEEILEHGLKLIINAFNKKDNFTYSEMHNILNNSNIPALKKNDVQSHIIRRAGRDGLICFGPNVNNKPTFKLLENLVPKIDEVKHEHALGELAKKYFLSHGPATIQDFMWWSGLKASDAKSGIYNAMSKLRSEKINDSTYYMPKKDGAIEKRDGIYLLPAFDEYLLGYKDRSAMLTNKNIQKMLKNGRIHFAHSNGIFLPTVVMNGQIVGTWKRNLDKGKATVTLTPFVKFTSEQIKNIKNVVNEYGEFLKTDITLKL